MICISAQNVRTVSVGNAFVSISTTSSPHSLKSIFAEVLALAVGGALVIILPFYGVALSRVEENRVLSNL